MWKEDIYEDMIDTGICWFTQKKNKEHVWMKRQIGAQMYEC